MRCQIVVLPEGGLDPRMMWALQQNRSEEEARWRELCIDRVKRAQKGDFTPDEIFLCLLGDELIDHCDLHALSWLLALVRDHCWGSSIFLVASERILISEQLLKNRQMIFEWLCKAVAGRVQDLLLVSYEPRTEEPLRSTSLQAAASRARNRHKVLRSLHPHSRPWRCLLPEEWNRSSSLLARQVQEREATDRRLDLVIVVGDPNAIAQRETVKRALERYPDRRYLVVTLRSQASPLLWRFCEERRLEPLDLTGELELWYLLIRLNYEVDRDLGTGAEAQAVVRADQPPTFQPLSLERLPLILFTSAFDPDQPGHCIAAARDVSLLLAESPLETPFRVEPAIRRERLIEVLSDVSSLKVWIHMGHGQANRGLWESGEARPFTIEQWLGCFRSRSRSGVPLPLELAIFLTCESAEAALRFAQAGVGMSIGFGAKVDTHLARQVAIQALKTIFRDGLSRRSLEQGFLAGKAALEALEWGHSQPVAYYPGGTL